MFDLILQNGMVVTPNGVISADVCVEKEKIVEIAPCGQYVDAMSTIDIHGKYLFPGVIDPHVHFNDPGLPEREDMRTGTMAGAAGGVTTVIDMPLSGNPTIISTDALEQKKSSAMKKATIDYALWGGLVNDNTENLIAMHNAGACAFKAFTCFAGEDYPYVTRDILVKGMEIAAEHNFLIGVHCEDEEIIKGIESAVKALGCHDVKAFLSAHPPIAEEAAVDMVLKAAEVSGAHVHICHASIPSVVNKVAEARTRGISVTVETCPHYLIFTEKDLEEQLGFLKCTPPVRKECDVQDLWDMLLAGDIDIVASDHSPSTLAQKEPSDCNFWNVWGGITGVQTLFPLLFYYGVIKRGLSVDALARLTSTNTAKIYGLWPKKGAILIGSDADFVVFDPVAKWKISSDKLLYKNKHSPYDGMEITGKVVMTFVRGQCVFDNGNIHLISGKLQICNKTNLYQREGSRS